jgi:uncharacterized protein (DUF433 family)
LVSTLTDRITIDPDICNGKPVVRGLRITVETILDYLSAGETAEEILRQHPMLEPEDISACLAFASRLMSHKYSVRVSDASAVSCGTMPTATLLARLRPGP